MMSLQQNAKQFTTKCSIFVVLNGVSSHPMQKQFLKRYESTLHKIVLSSNLIGKTETKSLVLCLTLVLTQPAGVKSALRGEITISSEHQTKLSKSRGD